MNSISSKTFFLWGYTDPISSEELKKQHTPLFATRDFFSLKERYWRTYDEFRQEHKAPVVFEYRATFELDELERKFDFAQIKLPKNCRIEDLGKSITVIWTETQAVNTYIDGKGLKYASEYLKNHPL